MSQEQLLQPLKKENTNVQDYEELQILRVPTVREKYICTVK